MESKKLKSFITQALRRASYKHPARGEALKHARVCRGIYKCAHCRWCHPKKDVQLDHTTPVVPVTGFDSWDGFIERLFCKADGLSVLCKHCHSVKTKTENKKRKEFQKK